MTFFTNTIFYGPVSLVVCTPTSNETFYLFTRLLELDRVVNKKSSIDFFDSTTQ